MKKSRIFEVLEIKAIKGEGKMVDAEIEKQKQVFIKRLNELIEEKGINNVSNASKEAGLDKETLGKYSVGNIPAVEIVLKISKYFNVSSSYLLGETDTRIADNIEVIKRFGIDDETISRLEKIKNINDENEQYADMLREIFINPLLYRSVVNKIDMLLKYYLDSEYKKEINKELKSEKTFLNPKKIRFDSYIELGIMQKFLEVYSEYVEAKMIEKRAFKEISQKRLEEDIKKLKKELKIKENLLKKYKI